LLPNPPAPLAEPASPYQVEKITGGKIFPLNLDLVATEDAWIEVETDGRVTFKGLVRATQKLSFDASQRIRIMTGNAPGLQLQFNGTLIVAGTRRRVRTIEFTSGGVRELNSAAAVTQS
jgi:hypothetical protein